MMAIKLGSSVRGLLGRQQAPYSEAQERVDIAEMQAAYNRLTAQLGDESLSRSELITLVGGLEPLARQLQRVLKGRKARDGQTRATQLMEDALQEIYGCLYSIQPFRPYIWPEALRAKLRRALNSLSYALIAVRWVRVA